MTDTHALNHIDHSVREIEHIVDHVMWNIVEDSKRMICPNCGWDFTGNSFCVCGWEPMDSDDYLSARTPLIKLGEWPDGGY